MDYDINRIAELSAIKLNNTDKDILINDISNIIDMVGELPEISEGAKNTDPYIMPLREDDLSESFQEDMLSNAPESEGRYFSVPKTVEG